jgi:predicted transcriptional regulator
MKTKKTEIKKNYFDALFYANATSTEKLPFHISPAEFKLMIKLIHYHNDQKNITWSSENISKQTSMSIGVVDKSIQRLKQKGYINTITYNTDTYTKHRTIFINWGKIEEVNSLYLNSIKNKTPESTILTQDIPEVQFEEKVSQMEENEPQMEFNEENINYSIPTGDIKFEDITEDMLNDLSEFKSNFDFYIPNILIEHMNKIVDKNGFIKKIKSEKTQETFNKTLFECISKVKNSDDMFNEINNRILTN